MLYQIQQTQPITPNNEIYQAQKLFGKSSEGH